VLLTSSRGLALHFPVEVLRHHGRTSQGCKVRNSLHQIVFCVPRCRNDVPFDDADYECWGWQLGWDERFT